MSDAFMWGFLKDHLPGWLAILCTFLVFAVPFIIYKVNQGLQDYGNPPWKNRNETDK